MSDSEPRKLKVAVIREELVLLTGHWRLALILNQFVYWSQRCRDFDQFLAEERARDPDLPAIPLTHGWIYKSAPEMIGELMLDISRQTMRRDIAVLIERGWLQERHNPKQLWDREMQYRPDIRRIQTEMQAMGYALKDYPLVMDNATSTMNDAPAIVDHPTSAMDLQYQRSTTKTPPEIKDGLSEKERDQMEHAIWLLQQQGDKAEP